MENETLTPAISYDEGTNDTSAIVEDGGENGPLTDAVASPGAAEVAGEAPYPDGSPEEREESEADEGAAEFETLLSDDLAILSRHFPGYFKTGGVGDLTNASRYGELREAGLSPIEAFCASHYETLLAPRQAAGNRGHLGSCIPRTASPSGERMSASELAMARGLFPSLSDREIEGLYRRVGHGKRH